MNQILNNSDTPWSRKQVPLLGLEKSAYFNVLILLIILFLELLGWPKVRFGFSRKLYRKTQSTFGQLIIKFYLYSETSIVQKTYP